MSALQQQYQGPERRRSYVDDADLRAEIAKKAAWSTFAKMLWVVGGALAFMFVAGALAVTWLNSQVGRKIDPLAEAIHDVELDQARLEGKVDAVLEVVRGAE